MLEGGNEAAELGIVEDSRSIYSKASQRYVVQVRDIKNESNAADVGSYPQSTIKGLRLKHFAAFECLCMSVL